MVKSLPDRALSVRQPWAWAIVHAGKDVENRKWSDKNPFLGFRGPIAIHAARSYSRSYFEAASDFCRRLGYDVPPKDYLKFGGIVGVAEIIDVQDYAKSIWYMGGKALILGHVRPTRFIPVRGALGIFCWRNRRA